MLVGLSLFIPFGVLTPSFKPKLNGSISLGLYPPGPLVLLAWGLYPNFYAQARVASLAWGLYLPGPLVLLAWGFNPKFFVVFYSRHPKIRGQSPQQKGHGFCRIGPRGSAGRLARGTSCVVRQA